MAHIYLVPGWFVGYDIALELAFAIITIIVSLYAFKIYRLSGQSQSRLFGLSFLFISISYVIQSLLNFAIMEQLEENISRAIALNNVALLNFIGIFIHIIFFMSALITLSYMTLRVRSAKVFSLLCAITFLALFFSTNKLTMYYVLASLMLIYICIHYLGNYWNNRQTKALLVFIGFVFLLFGTIHFIFSVNQAFYYFLGHALELIAYIFILINLILVVKK